MTGGNGSPSVAVPPPVTAQPLSAIAPAPKMDLALEYSAMEPDSDEELALEIQSVLAATEPRVTACWRLQTSPAMMPADANLGWQYFMNHE